MRDASNVTYLPEMDDPYPSPDHVRFTRGLFYGTLFSIPLWVVIIALFKWLFSW